MGAPPLREIDQSGTPGEPRATLDAALSRLAHEINNPLTYVMANLELLARSFRGSGKVDVTEMQEMVADSLEGADRIRRVIHRLNVIAGTKSLRAADKRLVAG